jgi:hypothetical protein
MKMLSLKDYVAQATHGLPPDRACLKGSDDKWDGYLLGVAEATHAADQWFRELTDRIIR